MSAVICLCLPLVIHVLGHLRPPEPALGAEDQGIYAQTAAHLTRTGTLAIRAEPLEGALASEHHLTVEARRTEAIRQQDASEPLDRYHIGFFCDPAAPSSLYSVFPPGFPLVEAAALQLAGWRGLGYVNLLCTMGAALSLFLIVARWHGVFPGLAASALLLSNPLEAWSATVGYAEPLAQWWLLLGLACASWWRPGSPLLMASAGMLLGLLPLVKIDALSVLAFAVVIGMHTARQDLRSGIAFMIALLMPLLILGWCSNPIMTVYVTASLAGALHGLSTLTVGLTVMVMALGIGIGPWLVPTEAPAWWGRWSRWGRALLIALLIGAACYGYFVRPATAVPDHFFYWPQNQDIASLREQTLVRLAWYLTPVGLAIAIVGCCGLIWSTRHPIPGALICLGIGLTALICYDILNNPAQPYAMRRLLVAGIPVMSYALAVWWMPLARWLPRVAPALGLTTILVLLACHQRLAWNMNACANQQGAVAQLDDLASHLPANALVVIGRQDPCMIMGSYLHLAKGIPVAYHASDLDVEALAQWRRLLERWHRAGRRLYYLALRFDVPVLPQAQSTRVHSGALTYQVMPYLTDRIPTEPVKRSHLYQISEFVDPSWQVTDASTGNGHGIDAR